MKSLFTKIGNWMISVAEARARHLGKYPHLKQWY
jgi:hypothetical protein